MTTELIVGAAIALFSAGAAASFGWLKEKLKRRSRAKSHAAFWLAEISDLRTVIDKRANWSVPFPVKHPGPADIRGIFERLEKELATILHRFFAEVERLSDSGELVRQAFLEASRDTDFPPVVITSDQRIAERELLIQAHRGRIEKRIAEFDSQKQLTLGSADEAIALLQRRV